MYVTTFYSFKGGVGRTFALVNVAIELAKTGRRVLLVDFDLEAPGIHTFASLRPSEPHPGIIEYVTDYVATRVAPDLRDFVYEVKNVTDQGGPIWIMPAGRGDCEYRAQLSSIDWQALYAKLDGFLFFEDLKAQWKAVLEPDYVLIDSRTGHTDVEGICTRQLPDAVVVLFFPNEQNLCGLKDVVSDIRSESVRTRKGKEPIALHFVMSNVPELDDEDGILKDRIRQFRRTLQYETHDVIHSYPSLSLLNQTIFTQDRPKSRLAKEYQRLKDRIVDENDEDAEGVVRFLRQLETPRFYAHRKFVDVDKRLRAIEGNHGDNGEVMFFLGMVRKAQGKLSEARTYYSRALALGYRKSAVLVERATCHAMMVDRAAMSEDLKQLLLLSELRDFELHRAVQLLGPDDKELLQQVSESMALQRADWETKWLIAETMCEAAGRESAMRLFEELLQEPNTSEEHRKSARVNLTLALMGRSDIAGAMRILGSTRPSGNEWTINDAFNMAMAEWAQVGCPPRDMFARVVELESSGNRYPGANFEQCLAVSLWAIGEREKAEGRLQRAIEEAEKIGKTEFSCWRYKEVSREEFLEDCEAIHALITSGVGHPRFFPCLQERN